MPTILASGDNYPDARSAGPAAAALGGRLLLADPVRPAISNGDLLAELESHADEIDLVYIAGGTAALPSTLDGPVLDAIQASRRAGPTWRSTWPIVGRRRADRWPGTSGRRR